MNILHGFHTKSREPEPPNVTRYSQLYHSRCDCSVLWNRSNHRERVSSPSRNVKDRIVIEYGSATRRLETPKDGRWRCWC